jgi:site-specific recombinase XerD
MIKEIEVNIFKTPHYVYQDAESNVIWPAINFINYIIKQKSDFSTIATYRQAIRSLFNFLLDQGYDWKDVHDEILGKYAQWQLSNSINNPRWRGNIYTTKRSINHDYISPVYEFFYWAQRQKLHPFLLGIQLDDGEKYQITSALPNRDKAKSKKDGPNQKLLYPRAFTQFDERSTSLSKKAEDWELEELNDYIRCNYNGYQRASLLLMVRIIDQTGSRPIALSGYTRMQFRKEIIDQKLMNTHKATLEVIPLKQKGSNQMPVKFPFELTNGVVAFIENDHKDFISAHGFDRHDGYLFLDPTNGTPLSAKDITKIFSGITKKLNWPKGKSIYALRHKYANEQMDIQASINDELGFSREENAVALQASENMTHRSSKTLLKDYLESKVRHGFKTKTYQQNLLIQELKGQNDSQKIEISKALELLDEQKKIENTLRKELELLKKETLNNC